LERERQSQYGKREREDGRERRRTDDATATKASNGRSTSDLEAVGGLSSRVATTALGDVVKTNASEVTELASDGSASTLVLGANVREDELLSGTAGALRRTDLTGTLGEDGGGTDLAGTARLGEGRGGGRGRDDLDGDGGRMPVLVGRGGTVVVVSGRVVTR
jgi:hypothetical protein